MSTTTYTSVSDTYTPTADQFDSIDEFLDMCRGCFGEAPRLTERSDGEWYDERGVLTLVETAAQS